ncbi:hypothetical protein D3C72_2178480 [compost metagenome]
MRGSVQREYETDHDQFAGSASAGGRRDCGTGKFQSKRADPSGDEAVSDGAPEAPAPGVHAAGLHGDGQD